MSVGLGTASGVAKNLWPSWEAISLSNLIHNYTDNLIWSLFLTSTAIHAILLITSPVQALFKWYRRQSSDGDTPIPYLCAVLGSLLWFRYSIFINDLKLILLQGYAVFMQTFFLLALLYYRKKKHRLLRLILAIFVIITGICASAAQIIGSFVCPYLIRSQESLSTLFLLHLLPLLGLWKYMQLYTVLQLTIFI
uniref:Sugar transporter SWEET1 n=1 Tax=Meloidogyne incognita TaxID=6306 RepID=A0A914MII4_MELIC